MSTPRPVSKKNGGYTLVEMLSAIVVLLLFTALLVTGINLAVDTYTDSVATSEAQTLCSTLQTVVSDELRYATQINIDEQGNITGVFSSTYGQGASFTTTEEGRVLLCDKKILSEKAYPHGLKARVNIEKYDQTTKVFTVNISIYITDGKNLSEMTFDVKNLNT